MIAGEERSVRKIKCALVFVALLGGFAFFYFLPPMSKQAKPSQSSHLGIQGAFFIPIEIAGFHSEIPYINLNVGDKLTSAKIDLGSNQVASMPSEIIEQCEGKSFLSKRFFLGMRGKQYESDVYLLPSIKINGIVFSKLPVSETNLEFKKDATLLSGKESLPGPLATIGWRLFEKTNFFLDCQHSLLAFCDSLETLKQKGYPVDSFIETPLLLDHGLIEFEAETDFGPMRCLLDTGCTWNMLNKDREGGANDHMIFNQISLGEHAVLNPQNSDLMEFDPDAECAIPMFKIGKKDFGEIAFTKFKTPLKIDAIIGMEFLESKLLFIDFPNRKIYFCESCSDPLPISLQKNL